MKLFVSIAVLGFFCLVGCTSNPGKVSITCKWDSGEPTEAVWISGRIVQVNPDTKELGQTVAELSEPHKYEAGMSLRFSEVPNGDDLAVVLQVRMEESVDGHIFWYGISESFSLAAGEDKDIEVTVVMVPTPVLSDLVMEEAVGPGDCPTCYVATNIVTLSFQAANAAAVEVANSNDFAICKHTLVPDGTLAEGLTLSTNEGNWHIEGWNLDCGLADTEDGPRSVYVRLLDAEGYPSQTLSIQVMLDRQPPTEGTLSCVAGGVLFSSAPGGLETTMLFGVVEANEMVVEACTPGAAEGREWATIPGGLLACDEGREHYFPVGEWTRFTTQGCVRLKDDSVKMLRVKYRDFAHNETPWVGYEFENVAVVVMPWVTIPSGTFMMGCSQGDGECLDDEKPPHSVTVSSFEMLETEVTESQFEAVMGKNPSNCFEGSGGADNPVECVNWFDARAFCEAMGGRLPTEAEWEYAARGGTETKYYCGDEPECLNDIAWFDVNYTGTKHSVKKKEPNLFGLYDMLGNVEEWTNDWYDDSYYESSPSSNPPGPNSDNHSPRVIRGGFCWADYDFLRVSNRTLDEPLFFADYIGFRCARSVEP
jgi:formylglycine-generating enzyme required for sulfatase activity